MSPATPTPEHELFRATTRAFLDKEVPISRVRELHDNDIGYDERWWREAVELFGWAGLLVPDALGGGSITGKGVIDLTEVAEELGRTVAPGPLHTVSAVVAGLVEAADSEVVQATLADILSGAVATWAFCEPGKSWNTNVFGVGIESTSGGFAVSGTKCFVEAGNTARQFLVTGHGPHAVMQVLVPATAPGVHVTRTESIDLVRQYAAVTFDNVELPAAAVVGDAESTPAIIEHQLQIAVLLQCAEMVGVLRAVFDRTLEWAFDRYTFGRPLASYQALKHRFADMKLGVESARATTAAAAAAVQQRSPDAAELVSVAKSFVGYTAPRILQDCVQLHGGIGVTWEHDLHLYLRRVTLNRNLFGTPHDHNLRLTDLRHI